MNRKKLFTLPLILMLCFLQIMPAFAATKTKTKSGTAKVWAGVPLIGHIYVCTPYKAKYTETTRNVKQGKKTVKQTFRAVKSVSTDQKSYTSVGAALIKYQHYDNWSVINSGKTSFNVYARGHCDFVFKKIPISLGLQTFVKTVSILR